MNKQIRKGVFETNSSSSHSLTMKPGDVIAQPFSHRVMREGNLDLRIGEFGWKYERFYSLRNKLQYLLTQITQGKLPEGEDVTEQLLAQSPEFAMMHRVVKAHTGVSIHVEPSEGYIDHQSVGVGMDLFKGEAALRDFLFSSESYVETGNDNSGYPVEIPTDRGPEKPYASSYATPAPGSVAVKLRTCYWLEEFTTKQGEKIEPDSPVMAQLQEHGVVTAVHWIDVCSFRSSYTRGKAETMSSLADSKFRFSESLEVHHEHRKPNEGEEESDSGVVTIFLPPEFAARFAPAQ
jgi:hypothetical protein